jgi:hypothetical protein
MAQQHDYRITTVTSSTGVGILSAYFSVERVEADGQVVMLTTDHPDGLVPVRTFNDERMAHNAAHAAASR